MQSVGENTQISCINLLRLMKWKSSNAVCVCAPFTEWSFNIDKQWRWPCHCGYFNKAARWLCTARTHWRHTVVHGIMVMAFQYTDARTFTRVHTNTHTLEISSLITPRHKKTANNSFFLFMTWKQRWFNKCLPSMLSCLAGKTLSNN